MRRNKLFVKKNNPIVDKTFQFSLNILELYILLLKKNEFELSEKLLNSSTNIRKNVEGTLAAISKQDYMQKIAMASKEAIEARFWLKMLQMKYFKNCCADECVDQLNEIINSLHYMEQQKSKCKVKLNIHNLN
ncbi:MAG: four helix bundle protein [Cytophagaceae bacterium]|nr:four helix bundle protein [Cytophagaceae bacterium]